MKKIKQLFNREKQDIPDWEGLLKLSSRLTTLSRSLFALSRQAAEITQTMDTILTMDRTKKAEILRLLAEASERVDRFNGEFENLKI